jgi:hypothetical protein
MDELAFIATNGKPCLIADHPLDNAYPFEVSQVELVGILLILTTLWLKALALRWIHQSMLIWSEDDSVSVGLDSCLWVVGKGSGEEQRKNTL